MSRLKAMAEDRFSSVLLFTLVIWLLSGCAPPSTSGNVAGTVVRVLDGDSLVVATARGEKLEVRLGEIDAPEKHQPHSNIARKVLTDLALGETVEISVLEIDQYGRLVGRVYRANDELSLNQLLVREGHAWVYRRYARDDSLLGLEEEAKRQQRGLWALPSDEIVPPWQWRRTHSNVTRQ